MWHGYFVVERGTVSEENWTALLELFTAMGTHNTSFPMNNTHSRTRLDGNAVIYESNFYPGEVSVPEFKQLLATEFGVPVEEIDDVQTVTSYSAGNDTNVWEIQYSALTRFTVRRFGRGAEWRISGDECRGYLKLHKNEWEIE